MSQILLLSGSPSLASLSHALLERAARFLRAEGIESRLFSVEDFPAEDLLRNRHDSPVFDEFKVHLSDAPGVIIGTPIINASYSGTLKTLLDIFPPMALRNKTVLPLVTGEHSAQELALDYSLRPLLSVLGATDLRKGAFVAGEHGRETRDGGFHLEREVLTRIDESLGRFAITVKRTRLAA